MIKYANLFSSVQQAGQTPHLTKAAVLGRVLATHTGYVVGSEKIQCSLSFVKKTHIADVLKNSKVPVYIGICEHF